MKILIASSLPFIPPLIPDTLPNLNININRIQPFDCECIDGLTRMAASVGWRDEETTDCRVRRPVDGGLWGRTTTGC